MKLKKEIRFNYHSKATSLKTCKNRLIPATVACLLLLIIVRESSPKPVLKNYTREKERFGNIAVNKPKKILNAKILMYHRVLDQKPQKYTHWHYVTTSDFKKQMQLIDKLGYTPITFHDYQLYLEDKLTLPAKPIIITFDDGYVDAFENAIPVLQQMDMKATFFVMGNRELKNASWDQAEEDDYCPLMSDEQVQKADKLGFEIGSHSLNHRALPELPDEELWDEVKKSRDQIESVIKKPVLTLSYPYGRVDKRIMQAAAEAGYLFGCGVYTGPPKFGETRFDFRRLAVNQHTSLLHFVIKILSPYEYLEWYYNRIKTRKKKPGEVQNQKKRTQEKPEDKITKPKKGSKKPDMTVHEITNSTGL